MTDSIIEILDPRSGAPTVIEIGGEQGVPGSEGVLPAGAPVDAAIAAGDLMYGALYKLQGQLNRAGIDVDALKQNVRGFSFIDMGGDDYTATAEESKASIILATNTGDGTKVLTLTGSAESPALSLVATFEADIRVTVGFTTDLRVMAGIPLLLGYLHFFGAGFGVLDNYKPKSTIPVSIPDSTYYLTQNDLGKCLIFTSATPVTVAVTAGVNETWFNCEIIQQGLGKVTLVPDAGDVTLQNPDGQYSTFGQFARLQVQGMGDGGPLVNWQVNVSGRTS